MKVNFVYESHYNSLIHQKKTVIRYIKVSHFLGVRVFQDHYTLQILKRPKVQLGEE